MGKILLVDDHTLIRSGIKSLINSLPGFEVVAEGNDGHDVEGLVKDHQPDILVLDLNMKTMGGLEVLERLRQLNLKVKVLILSMHTDVSHVMETLRLEAQGYLLKDACTDEMAIALSALMRNEHFLSSGVAHVVIASALKATAYECVQEEVSIPLTQRQIEILRLIARGCSTRDIAQGLGLSIKTIDAHRSQIMQRLGVRDVPTLVVYAIKNKLIDMQD